MVAPDHELTVRTGEPLVGRPFQTQRTQRSRSTPSSHRAVVSSRAGSRTRAFVLDALARKRRPATQSLRRGPPTTTRRSRSSRASRRRIARTRRAASNPAASSCPTTPLHSSLPRRPAVGGARLDGPRRRADDARLPAPGARGGARWLRRRVARRLRSAPTGRLTAGAGGSHRLRLNLAHRNGLTSLSWTGPLG